MICKKCGKKKKPDQFYDVYSPLHPEPKKASECKACKSEYNRRKYLEKKDEIKENSRLYRIENKEAIKKYRRRYYEKNMETQKARAMEYYHNVRKVKG